MASPVESFHIRVDQPILDDLHARLERTRWPEPLEGGGWTHGVSVAYMRELAAYWRTTFDWRAREERLNRFRQVRVTLKGGARIHVIHERGRGPRPLPIILTHGFPDSIVRFEKLIPLLTDPGGHRADPEDSFDVIAPSLPGYAFSDRAHGTVFQIGDLWNELMTEHLGYERYVAHGGDWGSTITDLLARAHGRHVAAIHLTDVPFLHALRKPDDVDEAEREYLAQIAQFTKRHGAYAAIQGSQPELLALGLNDSPVALAAWLVEKFRRWSDCDGDVERRFTKDELLTNVMLYWATGTINSSFLPYYDVTQADALTGIREQINEWRGTRRVPAAFAIFPKDLSDPPRRWAERFFDVQRWTRMDSGGHFAAMEEPELLARDLRVFFRQFR
jgi:microsomal epoxide hydrolase